MRFLIFALIVAVAQATSVEEQWETFKVNHGKSYKSLLEESRRLAIFKDNLKEIEEHNERYNKGEVTYTLGINQFSDMTQEEFEATLTPLQPMPKDLEVGTFNGTGMVGDEFVNWVTAGYVTPVQNQGTCGSCWTFSSAGALEGLFKKYYNQLVYLSEQYLLDCVPSGTCAGGRMDYAFDYVRQYGIPLQNQYYAYVGAKQQCRYQGGGTKIRGYVRVPSGDEASLLQALTYNYPISVAIESIRLKQYSGGIFGVNSGCGQRIDHAVLLVGAGVVNGIPYWLVKNSWGTGWGEYGYFRITRGNNACGIALELTYPVL